MTPRDPFEIWDCLGCGTLAPHPCISRPCANAQERDALIEIARLRRVIERDRAAVCISFNDLRRRMASYWHLREFGRGPYAWDDDRYQLEFGQALDHFVAGLEALRSIARDWSDCPTDPEEIRAARAGIIRKLVGRD